MEAPDRRLVRGVTAVSHPVACPGDAVRYAIRQVGAGWTVYDYRDLEAARVQGRLQIGLEYEAALAVAESLTRSARLAPVAPAPTLPRAA